MGIFGLLMSWNIPSIYTSSETAYPLLGRGQSGAYSGGNRHKVGNNPGGAPNLSQGTLTHWHYLIYFFSLMVMNFLKC